MENIGSLMDFLGPADEYTLRLLTLTNTSYVNTAESRNNTPSPCYINFRKSYDSRYSPIKTSYHGGIAGKTLDIPQPIEMKSKIRKNSLTDNKSSITTRPQSCIPDYSRVKSRISSIRERDEKNDSKPKVSLRDKVRNEILLKKDQIILRTMNKTLRSDEKAISVSKPESDAGFIRLAERMKNIKYEPKDFPQQKKPQNSSNVVQKSHYAKKKVAMISQAKWLKTHGNINKQNPTSLWSLKFL
ncbi:hypothetical protein SteCoe_11991 [Stentor coeruleus]|uniref:Uncharacterized protein n=1 Tax=Stentor coeruleus TaxID=5963 RepID=A0A1R2CBW5_9CILI|nr:hypothetical protein SteCoe_11991 [Stentor coeruleus]